MGAVEPGERFTITYGSKETRLEVVSLSWRQQRDILAIDEFTGTVEQCMQELEKHLRHCVSYMSDDEFSAFMDRMNLPLVREIIRKTNEQARLSNEEEKKPESQPSSAAESSVTSAA